MATATLERRETMEADPKKISYEDYIASTGTFDPGEADLIKVWPTEYKNGSLPIDKALERIRKAQQLIEDKKNRSNPRNGYHPYTPPSPNTWRLGGARFRCW